MQCTASPYGAVRSVTGALLYLYIDLSDCMSADLSVSLSLLIYLSIYLSAYMSISRFVEYRNNITRNETRSLAVEKRPCDCCVHPF